METIQYTSFISLIEEIDLQERVQRDRGTLFEILVKAYLTREPMYEHLFDAVWMLHEVPKEYKIPKKDTGVDLVARARNTGNLVAIQCKYYAKNRKIDKKDIDSFLNEVGKSFYAEGIIVSTTDNWTTNANDALLGRSKQITRIGLSELQESKIDWAEFSFARPKEIKLQAKKVPRLHQIPAIDAVVKGFETADRGKLIMAPGTGKTYTSMAIMEELAKRKGDTFRVLYLVPSIQLLSQSLRGWAGDTNFEMDTIAVCSDRKVTKKSSGESDLEDITSADIGYPATTNYEKLLKYQQDIELNEDQARILTVFSTYQSIDVVIEAQQNGFYEFDLLICDEAHRTTGATESGKEASSFVKVHDNKNIKSRKRLYQTATPRVYGDKAKQKADEMSVLIADMSDEIIYGEEFYRIGFGEAVNKGILSDYKVMILAVDESVVARQFQSMFASDDGEMHFDDVTKIIGCWNGLIKRKSNSDELTGQPMKRAIAFTGTIKESKMITQMFNQVVEMYINDPGSESSSICVEIDHADGSMNALKKNEKINWLKSEVPDNTCRILSNARFLTEGVDIPDLDAVMFLKPRKSKIDIAQAVGRVMRKSPNKDYGYVILPVGVPMGADENQVLDNNEKYRVVWEVLNALRSLDERFDATINKLEMNKKKPNKINVVGVGSAPDDGYDGFTIEDNSEQLTLFLEEEWSDIERAIYGKIVKKVGNVRYWEEWSKDVAIIAQQHITRINIIIEDRDSYAYQEFCKFLTGLRNNINGSITEQEAIEMLSQHMITKPVFDALFEGESFAKNNPVSQAMDGMINVLESLGLSKEHEKLEGFYESVRIRAEGLDNLKAKQDIIVQLYDKFFKVGFSKTTEKLGIVFTPTEVVDFIVYSVEAALNKYFGKSLSDIGVNVLDPFTGTGTFITRILQSGLVSKEDMFRKYTQELHANEIVLLSYYIAAINIEETYNTLTDNEKYEPFEGIVLTDTFESTEKEDVIDDDIFGDNERRIKRQREIPINVIVGNPPYSARQTNDNDNNKNNSYRKLDEKIRKTYVENSSVTNKNTLYDSLIRAFRWSTDRIGDKGVIGFVTNSSYIDAPTTQGIRKCFFEDFNYIYVLNLRGAVRGRSGDDAKKEGQNVFEILTGVAICILVKDGSDNHKIFYNDIGDYLSRKEKLMNLSDFSDISNLNWINIIPDKNHDWINQRDEGYQKFTPLDPVEKGIFDMKSLGVSTNRDAWVYGYSKAVVEQNTERMVRNFNYEIERLANVSDRKQAIENVNSDPKFISWSRGLKNIFAKGDKIELNPDELALHSYRPFTKKWLYYDKNVIEMSRKFRKTFGDKNRVILVPGMGSRRDFSCIMVDSIPDLNMLDAGAQGFSLYNNDHIELFSNDISNINKKYLDQFQMAEEDLFYYIYAVLHSKDYRNKFQSDLKKSLPRIPKLKNYQRYVEVGYKLSRLHINYEEIPPYTDVQIEYKKKNPSYLVQKMKFQKRGRLDTIIYNSDITIKGVPEKAYEYVINGRSAIEWVIDQYKMKIDSASGLIDDPNEYSNEPQYIFNLLLSIINVSVQTVDLVNSLPPFEIEE